MQRKNRAIKDYSLKKKNNFAIISPPITYIIPHFYSIRYKWRITQPSIFTLTLQVSNVMQIRHRKLLHEITISAIYQLVSRR